MPNEQSIEARLDKIERDTLREAMRQRDEAVAQAEVMRAALQNVLHDLHGSQYVHAIKDVIAALALPPSAALRNIKDEAFEEAKRVANEVLRGECGHQPHNWFRPLHELVATRIDALKSSPAQTKEANDE